MFGDVAFAQAPFAALGGNTFNVSTSETVTIASILDAESSFGGLIDEAATALDTLNGVRIFLVSIAETVAGEASQNRLAIFAGTIEELATAIATQSAIKTANASVVGIQLVVSINNVLVWGPIDDNQNPNWQNINDTQTPGWMNLPS